MGKFIKFSVSFTVPKDEAEHEIVKESITELTDTIQAIGKKLMNQNKENKWHVAWQDLGWANIPTVDYDEVEILEDRIEEYLEV